MANMVDIDAILTALCVMAKYGSSTTARRSRSRSRTADSYLWRFGVGAIASSDRAVRNVVVKFSRTHDQV
jgi:hypothetical protein